MSFKSTYTASDGRTITRITFRAKEGEVPFHALWVEGLGDIGDTVIGKYKAFAEAGGARREYWGPMFGSPDKWISEVTA